AYTSPGPRGCRDRTRPWRLSQGDASWMGIRRRLAARRTKRAAGPVELRHCRRIAGSRTAADRRASITGVVAAPPADLSSAVPLSYSCCARVTRRRRVDVFKEAEMLG